MKLLPVDVFEIVTELTCAEIIARLEPQVAPRSFLARSRRRAEFVGRISKEGFELTPVIGSQSSFLPAISGRFLPAATGMATMGTQVDVQMIPGAAVLTIVASLCGILSLLIFYKGWLVFLLIGGNVLLSWLCSIAGFWIEGGAVRRRLIKILS